MVKTMLLVGVGGGLGSLLRYSTTLLINRYFFNLFPLATFSVNVLGCFLLGLLLGFLGRYSEVNSDLNLLLVVGFCGGYTTFSTFSLENLRLLQSGQLTMAITYMTLSIAAGIIAIWAGIYLLK